MPVATIKTPEGKVIKIQVPEGATQEQILQFVSTQDLSKFQPRQGMVENTSAEVQNAPVANQQQETLLDDVVGGAELALSVGSGLIAEPIAGLTALAASINPFNPPGTAANRVEQVREMLTYTPRTKSGSHALVELSETLEPIGTFFENLTQQAGDIGFESTDSPLVASLTSAIPTAIGEMLGAGVGRRAAMSTPKIKTDVQQATNRAVQDIVAQESQTGVKQMTTDVINPESRIGQFFQQQGELVAPSQRTTQQAERVKAVDKLLTDYDVTDGARFEGQIVRSVRDSIDEFKQNAAVLFDESVGQLDQLGDFDLQKTKNFAKGVIEAETKKGSLADQSLIDSMQGIIDSPEMSFQTAKSVRSSVGKKIADIQKGAPVQGNSDLGLQKQLYSRLSQDMESFARNADKPLFDQWKKADKVFSEFATSGNKTSAKRLIKEGATTPEIVDQLLFSKKDSDLNFLKENLTPSGQQAAKQRILQMALVKSSPDGDELNPNRFRTQLNTMRNQIGKFFTPEERKAIFTLRDVLSKTSRAQDASLTTATGQQLVPLFALTNPAVLVPGVVQAIVETPKLRNLLIKRNASKSAKERNQFDQQMIEELRKSGLIGAATTGSALQQEQE